MLANKKPLKPYSEKNFTLVNTKNKLENCFEFIKNYGVVGVDAENHSNNSYEGFLCLIQLSVYPVVD